MMRRGGPLASSLARDDTERSENAEGQPQAPAAAEGQLQGGGRWMSGKMSFKAWLAMI